MRSSIFLVLILLPFALDAQDQPDYERMKKDLVARFAPEPAGKFESFGKGVKVSLVTSQKLVALTFDACGGPNRGDYDVELIRFLRSERVPATLFLTGLWMDEHPDLALELARDSLFEIENHGLTHRPCSVNGASRYHIRGTMDVGEVVDEIELNARKIRLLNHRSPLFFRAATATSDQACGKIAAALGETIVNFDALPGDAVGGTPANVLEENLLKQVHRGAIILMHMNHPEWNGCEALKVAVPKLRKMGYSFTLLKNHALSDKQ